MTRLRDFLFALFLSLVLWAFVTISTNPDATAVYNNLPVRVRGLSPGLVIVNEDGLPRANQSELPPVSVVVETDRLTLEDLSQSDLEAYVDLSERGPGAHIVPVEVESSRRNVRFLSIEPPNLSIRMERVVTDTVPITIEMQGTLPFSYERDEPEFRVNGELIQEAQVRGPQSQVDRVVVAVNTINIDDFRATYESSLQLRALDANGDVVEGVELEPDQVIVSVNVRSVVGLKRVPVLGNVEGSPALGYVVTGIESDPPLVNLVGSSRLLNRIDWVETEPIDISDALSTITREVRINFRGAQPQEGEPRLAEVVVDIAPLDQPYQANIPVPVQVVGDSQDMRVDVSPPVIELSLEASTREFVQLRVDMIDAFVDVGGLSPGFYTLTPEVAIPEDFNVVGEVPEVSVSVSLLETPELRATSTPTPAESPEPRATSTPTPTAEPADEPAEEPAPADEPTAEPADEPTSEPETDVITDTEALVPTGEPRRTIPFTSSNSTIGR